MAHDIRRTVHTRWSADAALAYLLDFTHAEEWDSGTVSCTLLSGDGGVGTRYRNVSEFRGNQSELEYVVESVGADRFVITGCNKTITSKDTVTVTRDGDGASVDYRAEMTFHGVAALVSPFLGGALNKLGDDTAAQLWRVLDEHADAAGHP